MKNIEIEEYKRESEYFLEETVDDLTKEINKRILDKILKR